MAIKNQPVLTKEDFEAALIALRLSVSEVARDSGIPRHQVSHFRGYGDGLKPEQSAKLRDYFESKGVEFTDEDDATSQPAATVQGTQPAAVASPSPRLDAALKVEYSFPISNTIPDDVIGNTMDIMEEADARLVALFKTKIERDEGFFGDGDLTDETKAALQEAFALMAGNYLAFRMLRGWRAFNVKPATETPETVRDMVFETFKQTLIESGLIDPDGTATAETEPATETEHEEVTE